jgi:hypothetical protein
MNNLLKKLSFDDKLIQSYLQESDLITHDIIEKRNKFFFDRISFEKQLIENRFLCLIFFMWK